MNLQQLEYFKTVAETQSFTVAASLASVTQPALSKAISKLEDELNVTLFERNGRTVTLTVFGEAFLKHSNAALLEIVKGVSVLESMTNLNKEIVSIASTDCIGTYFMPYIISSFLNISPDTQFQFSHKTIFNILSALREGSINFGFFDNLEMLQVYTEITAIPIKKESYALIVPKSHPLSNKTKVSLMDLKNESFIVTSDESRDMLLSWGNLVGYTPRISIQPNEISMLGGLVAAGAGITIAPSTPLINRHTFSVIPIKEDIGYKTIYMGWVKDAKLSIDAKNFKEHVKSSATIDYQ